MNPSDLALKMLAWEQAQKLADQHKAEIEIAVLEIGKTQTVGNVKATFSNGRKSYDYKAALEPHPELLDDDTLDRFTTIREPRVDWRGICKYHELEDVPFTQSAPSVTVKLVD